MNNRTFHFKKSKKNKNHYNMLCYDPYKNTI